MRLLARVRLGRDEREIEYVLEEWRVVTGRGGEGNSALMMVLLNIADGGDGGAWGPKGLLVII